MRLTILFIAFLLLYSCKTQKNAGVVVSAEVVTDESFRKPMNDKSLFNAINDLVPIDSAFMRKDTLHIFTKRILGCDAENFKLIWNGVKTKTLPRETSVKLFEEVDATCKERHKFHLLYNINTLKAKQDTIVINLGGWKRPLNFP